MSGEKIKNIGPKSMAWLRQTGIRTQADLETVGSLAAYVRIKRAGFKPSLNMLYAMEGAILGCHWQDIPAERRSELIIAADAEVALLPQPKYKRMPVAGPVTTTNMEREENHLASEDGFGFDDPASSDHDEH
jgi:DNA transformation protein and related proteins